MMDEVSKCRQKNVDNKNVDSKNVDRKMSTSKMSTGTNVDKYKRRQAKCRMQNVDAKIVDKYKYRNFYHNTEW